MKNKLFINITASLLACASLSIEAAGFREITVQDSGNKELTVGLWYPSKSQPPAEANTVYELAVALDTPVDNTNGGLILISHGHGGWYAGHADTAIALADAGFVVAAPSHNGNTWSDMSSPIEKWALDRPRHISRVIDHLLQDSQFASHIDPEKVGLYGFSAGGFTALSLIGAVPDLDHGANFCQQQGQGTVCEFGMINAMRSANLQERPISAWGADPRIKAVSISAPGLGFAYTRESLASVVADIQLWSGELDRRVPTKSNAASLAALLPTQPETHWVKNANHFAFMVVACRDAFRENDPEEYQMVCGDADGFDRYAFHDEMHKEMIRFFSESFGL